MEVSAIIDGINARKAALGMTNQQISDASGVPKSTVDRILRKDTENPTIAVILPIADAVGYDFSNRSTSRLPDRESENPYIRHIIYMYESQLAAQERQYNLVTAEKNRWIKLLTIIIGILVTGIMFVLIYDITHPDIGWFQREVAYNSGSFWDNVLMSVWSTIRR